eukprot:COSAG02_NODE_1511_length_12223_cov_3.893105_2_plen_312_part_00
MMRGMDQMMSGMMQRHNQMFQEMDRMMGSGFDDPFFSGGRAGGGMLGGSPFGMLGDRGGGGGGGGDREGRAGGRGGEMELFGGGGMMGGFGGGGSGNGAMFMQSSVMHSDGKNTYRRDAQHKQVGDVHESNFHERDSRSQREAIGLRRGLGERSRAVTRTRHGGGDEEVHNVLNGIGEAESSKFDAEWQGRAYGAGAARHHGLGGRGGDHEQRRLGGPQPQRTAVRALPGTRSSERPRSRGNDIAPQGDIYGAYGSDQRGGDVGSGSARPQRFARATPQLEGPRGGGGGGGGSSRARGPAPSHRMMTPQAD